MSDSKLQSLQWCATRLGVSYARAAELARQELIPVVRLGRQIKVSPSALEEFILSGGKALPGGWRREA